MLVGLLCTALAFPADTKHALKFQSMISAVSIPPKAIEFIDSPKQRVLFKGVAAAQEDPSVVRAFSIVYEDLGPVRLAGKLIFAQLEKVAASATEQAASAGDLAALASLASSRNLFRLVDSDASGSLDESELLGSPELLALIRQDGETDAAAVERFMAAADGDGDGSISFVEFANAAAAEPSLQMADDVAASALEALSSSRELFDLLDSDASGSLDESELLGSPELLALIRQDGETDAAAVERFMAAADGDGDGSISFAEFASAAGAEPRLQMADEAMEAARQWACAKEGSKRGGAFGRKSPDERFDAMLSTCHEWEAQLDWGPTGAPSSEGDDEDGRLLQVLKGSFAGARCEPVAEALKQVYIEYSPLRLGGDLIFKLLKRVVAAQTK